MMKRHAQAILMVLGFTLLGVPIAGAESKQEAKKAELEIKVDMDYLLYLPKGYGEEEKKWPLMVFLHGRGESGNDLEKVKKHGPPKLIEQGKEFPFIIVSPQCPRDRWWTEVYIDALIDKIVDDYSVDEDRIYMTGLSMGGFGTWNYAGMHADRLAAIAPICGGGDPILAWSLKNLPIWAFHGEKDHTVPVERTKMMVEAARSRGNDEVKMTIYPDAEHDSWTETYNNPELYEWFLSHTRKKR
ncbi:MAG: prolyl oligopeptidase family serine peptidase [Candidatus Omnitrophica bacterium]|nr:prolyl oligopeptidase family serine peptidase [Candidatus Omnitrophota bacterium]MCB9782883.1 prolyl oligopeptidase family serine peptidase [Candidatus Omnitrophota bacterium]